ncbi:MAG: hypothetical protein EHM55_13415 [Acidobacteria bacterium]|nr:MAG: hypothetical protein EHM55_13415 [Acidobacteriota bacterium]
MSVMLPLCAEEDEKVNSGMSIGETPDSSSRQQVKEACVAHTCPNCGADHHVTVEQVLRGDSIVTLCHCRACGHSWHPVVGPAQGSQQSR